MGCWSQSFTNCWSAGIITTSQSLDFTESDSGRTMSSGGKLCREKYIDDVSVIPLLGINKVYSNLIIYQRSTGDQIQRFLPR